MSVSGFSTAEERMPPTAHPPSDTAPLHKDLRDPEYLRWKAHLARTERWSASTLSRHQLKRIRSLVQWAYRRTPGYRRLWSSLGGHPEDIRSLADFRRLPPVRKEDLQDALAEFSIDLPDRSYATTGGSTGIPFGFYRDGCSFARELASKAHQYARVGWQEGDRQLVLRGLSIDTEDHTQYLSEFNELRCSTYHLLPEVMEIYRQRACEYQPHWLRCYPSAGYAFARWLLASGRPFPPLKGILCASENLYPFQKELLARVFGARVFCHYGHYELAVLAGFCERRDVYHVLPQYGHAELLTTEGKVASQPGQSGEIVATSFIMHATPFIRYRTGDVAVFESNGCDACGRPYQIWSHIEGRLQEFIVADNGRRVSMTALNFHDDLFDHVRQFQLHQRTPGVVTWRFIPAAGFSSADRTKITRALLQKMGPGFTLNLEEVGEIPRSKRGKHRFLAQELPLPDHDG
jgi:phenylacetate-CoA ligase